ncbi:hypothetical protein BHE74_00044451 [Ensete ventricosum]|nr:hypothetical protein BHE74_00044451 [Ensete ventricosum]
MRNDHGFGRYVLVGPLEHFWNSHRRGKREVHQVYRGNAGTPTELRLAIGSWLGVAPSLSIPKSQLTRPRILVGFGRGSMELTWGNATHPFRPRRSLGG